jgi:hypothetical protein
MRPLVIEALCLIKDIELIIYDVLTLEFGNGDVVSEREVITGRSMLVLGFYVWWMVMNGA